MVSQGTKASTKCASIAMSNEHWFHNQGGYYNSLILQAPELPPWASGSYVPNYQGKTTF